MYKIDVDAQQGVVAIRLGGMISVAEVGEYIAELKRQFVLNRLRTYRMIIDVTECPIQAQDTIQAMAEHMATMPKASAIAIVTGSSLARLQIKRLFTQSYSRITATIEEGKAWILDGVEPTPA